VLASKSPVVRFELPKPDSDVLTSIAVTVVENGDMQEMWAFFHSEE
jgi:hypothetical protein